MGLIILNLIMLIAIYILYRFYFYFSQKPNLNFRLSISKLGFWLRFFFLTVFFLFFVFFFRFLNLFRVKNKIDLVVVFDKIQEYPKSFMIIFLIFLIFLIRFIINFIKITFIRVHYFLMNFVNFKFWDEYSGIVYFFANWHNRLILYTLKKNIFFFQFNRNKFYIFFKYAFSILIFLVFLYEFYFNNYCLDKFIVLLPWYSLYKLLYNINYFIIYNMDYLFDSLITSILYPENIEFEIKMYNTNDIQSEFFPLKDYIKNKLLK